MMQRMVVYMFREHVSLAFLPLVRQPQKLEENQIAMAFIHILSQSATTKNITLLHLHKNFTIPSCNLKVKIISKQCIQIIDSYKKDKSLVIVHRGIDGTVCTIVFLTRFCPNI